MENIQILSPALHSHQAPPTERVTQNHIFKTNALSFTKLGNDLGISVIALCLDASEQKGFSVSSVNSLAA